MAHPHSNLVFVIEQKDTKLISTGYLKHVIFH